MTYVNQEVTDNTSTKLSTNVQDWLDSAAEQGILEAEGDNDIINLAEEILEELFEQHVREDTSAGDYYVADVYGCGGLLDERASDPVHYDNHGDIEEGDFRDVDGNGEVIRFLDPDDEDDFRMIYGSVRNGSGQRYVGSVDPGYFDDWVDDPGIEVEVIADRIQQRLDANA